MPFILPTTDSISLNAKDQASREFDLGLLMVRRNQTLEALERFKRVIALDPKQLPDVLIVLYKRLNAQFGLMGLRLLIANLYFHCKLYTEALHELEEAVDMDADYTQSYLLLSKLYKHFPDKNVVRPLFEKAFKKGLRDAAILDLLPKLYLETGHYDQGVSFYETLVSEQPSSHHYKALLSFYFYSGQHLEAAKIYEKLSAESPEEIGVMAEKCEELASLNPDDAQIRRILISIYIKGFHPLKALHHLEQLMRLGHVARTDAIQELRDMLSLFPNTHDILLYLSDLLIQESAFSEAVSLLQLAAEHVLGPDEFIPIIRLLKRVLNLYPNQIMALQLLSDISFKQHHYSESLSYITLLLVAESSEFQFIGARLLALMDEDPDLALDCRLGLARVAFKKGEFAQCSVEAMRLKHTKHDLAATFLLSELALAQGQPESALSLLFTALESHSESWALHERIQDLQKSHVQTSLDTLLKTPAPLGKISTENLLKMGILYLYLGDFYKALDHFQKIESGRMLFPEAQLLISRCFLEMGRYDLSVSQLTRLLQSQADHLPFQNRVRYLMSINYLHMGDLSQAMHYLEKIMEYDVNFPNVQSLIAQKKNESFLDLRGLMLGACLDTQESLAVFSIQNLENETFAHTNTLSFAHPHNNNGVTHVLKRNLKTAEEEFKLALQMDNSLTATHCNLSVLYLLKQDYGQAMSHLDRASEHAHKLDAIGLTKGLAYMMQSQLDKALVQFEAAYTLNPHNPLVLFNLGELYYRKHRLQDAVRYWRQALATGHVFHLLHRRLRYLSLTPETLAHWTELFTLSFIPYFSTPQVAHKQATSPPTSLTLFD
ncbi:MAG: tetratricopeptide repeat protein [Candidatus Margulisbacteria bacterium]|nr:tetratricopeptide repeat protein [Candidatus Margulisiibacteriota bacterium]